jgi:8-oxo-dGTP pyrophosphatase MutT (NUDIX family)
MRETRQFSPALKLYSLIVLASDMRVLMVKRPPTGIFPDLHVFPGGHVEEADVIEAGKRQSHRPSE